MIQETKKAPSVGDRLRLARQLHDDIKGHMDRDEEVPQLLRDAYEEFQSESSVLMAHPNRAVRVGVGHLAQSMEDSLMRATLRAEARASGLQPSGEEGGAMAPIELPGIDAELDGLEYGITQETMRAASIMGSPIEMKDGRPTVTDHAGMEWDLSEQFETLTQPEVARQLRQAFMGQIPGGDVESATVGAMPMMQLAIEGAAALGVGSNVRNVDTAYAGLTLPWKVGFNPDGSFRGDEEELLADPRWARALKEVASSFAPPSALETGAHALAGGVDFLVFNRLLGMVGKGLAAARAPGLARVAAAAKVAKAIPGQVLPGSSVAKTAFDFMLYESAAQATNPDTSAVENALHGLEQGVVFGVAGAAAKALRGGAQRLMGIPRANVGAQVAFDEVIAKAKKSALPLGQAMAAQESSRYARAAGEHLVDAHLLGVLTHAWGASQAAPEGERFDAFWRGLFAAESHAAGVGFALNSALQYGLSTRPAVKAYVASPEFRGIVKRAAEFFASPRAEEPLREAWDRFNRMREEDPSAFEGVAFVSPAKRAAQEREVEQRSIPTDAGKAFEAMKADDAAAGQPKLLTMGEFHVERLRALGFDAKTDAGVYKHALNAVHEYLSKIEGNGERYGRVEEVPRAIMERMFRWRDGGKLPRAEHDRRQRELDFERSQPEAVKEPGRPVVAPPGPDRPSPAELVQAVEGEPAYQGLAPLEQVAKAEEKARVRRPTLGQAIKRVLEGKRDAAWLRETFPEGAAAVGDGKPESWVGAFERAVRDTWDANRAKQASSNLARMRSRRPDTVRSAVKRLGGLRSDVEERGEVRMLSEEDARLVNKKPGKGVTIDDAAEKLWELGYFPERPTVNEVIDALFEDRHHPDSARRFGSAEERRAREFEIARHREALESGEAPMLPRDQLFEVMAGDARYHQMTPEQVEKEVLALRAQADAGDPGPVLAGPPDTPVTIARRAAVKTGRLVETLKALEVLDPLVTPQSHEAVGAIGDLLYDRRPPHVPEVEWKLAREAAREVQSETREAVRHTMQGTWDEAQLAKLEDAWSFIDARQANRDVPAEVRDRLKDWIDESGELKTSVVDRLQQETYERTWALAKLPEETELGSFLTPVAFTGRKFLDAVDNKFGVPLKWAYWLDKPAVQRWLAQPLPRRAFRAITGAMGRNLVFPLVNLGPISAPQSSQMRRLNQRNLHRLRMEQSEEQAAMHAAQVAANMTTRPFGGARMPQEHSDLLVKWTESGFLGKAKGPQDLEAARPGTGYLFEPWTRFRSEFERIGRDLVSIGRMSLEEFEHYAGGKYLTHAFIRAQSEADAADVSGGRLAVRYAGRSMRRENGLPRDEGPIMEVPDAVWRAQRGIYEEARTLRVFRTLFGMMDDPGLGALSRAEHDGMRGTFDHHEYELAAAPVQRRVGETWPEAAARYAAMKKYPARAITMGVRLARDREMMAPKGKPRESGQRSYTERMDKLYRFFLEQETYIPTRWAQELAIQMNDVFAPPSQASRIGSFFDTLFAFKKRGLTLFRPQTWTLMLASNVERNHVLGGVSRWDAMRGFLGLPSFTRDAIDGMETFLRWAREDSPQKRPATWSDNDWSKLLAARRFFELSGHSTSLVQGLGADFAAAVGANVHDPALTRQAWEARMNEQAQREGWSDNDIAQMQLAIGVKTDAMYRGLEKVDAKILELLGSGNPYGEAKAKSLFSTVWNMADLFLFKYPTFLKLVHENPDMAYGDLLRTALRKTTDAADTDPWFRSYVSMRAPWRDAVWKESQGRVAGLSVGTMKLWAAQLVRDRFWIDQSSMMPQIVASMGTTRGLLRGAASLALVGGFTAALGAMWDEEDRKKWEEEQLTARRSISRWPAMNGGEIEVLERLGARVGSFAGIDASLPTHTREKLVELWRGVPRSMVKAWARQLGLTDPAAVQFPRRGGETQTGSFLQATPYGEALNTAQAARRLVGGAAGLVSGELSSTEAARDLIDATERVMGMRMQASAQMLMGAIGPDSPLVHALGGDANAAIEMLVAIGGMGGLMHSPLGLFTPEGQYIGEAVALQGQRWNQNLRGIRRSYAPEGAGERLLGVGAKLVWPSRSVFQRDPLRTPVDGWTAILSELYPGFDPSSEEGRTKLAAHKWTSEQMSVLMSDLYDQWFDEVVPDPTKASWKFDEMVRGSLGELFAHTDEDAITGRGFIEPHYKPEGVLLQAIAGLPEELRGEVIPHLKTWASSSRFQEQGMNLLFQLGRVAEMPKSLFREAVRNAMNDPDGTNLVKWWWSQAKDADNEKLGLLAPLIYDVETPGAGDALKAYRRLIKRYTEAGYDWPPTPATSGGSEVPGADGNARALQGGKALRRVLFERQSAVTELLAPR